jgi:hypothetical protein
MRTITLLAAALAFSATPIMAQCGIDAVLVETYYVSDANDATDVIGGGLQAGSRTYRVFVDLCDGCSVRAIYGDANHALRITSTAPFFNHADRGRTFAHELSNGALDEGTTALDSWLALGGASNQRFGILKADDPDGSIVGGANNDGGSEAVAGGLLVNADVLAGTPLTEKDGLIAISGAVILPPNFNVIGIHPEILFDAETVGNEFLTNDSRVGCSTPGVQGPTAENRVLLAQLTTSGEISFELNLEVECPDGTVSRYVANDSVLLEGETAFGQLNYPPECGCTDPNFLEYDPNAGCDDGSCATTIIFGCLDTLACNYDPSANFNVVQLCCYGPANCNGLDVNIVCPDVSTLEIEMLSALRVFPNPVQERLHLQLGTAPGTMVDYELLDATGRSIRSGLLDLDGSGSGEIVVHALPPGTYLLMVRTAAGRTWTRVVKA